MARKQYEEEPESLDRWLVSYADFVTLLFAFFVVMYSISSVNEEKYKELSASVWAAFRAGTLTPTLIEGGPANEHLPVEDEKLLAQSVKRQIELEAQKNITKLKNEIELALQPLIQGGQVKIKQSKGLIAIEINDSALFESGGARPQGNSADILTDVGQLLARTQLPIRVEGFSDDIPIRNAFFPSNWELSAARAGSIVRLFEESGIPPERLVAIGRAETQPIADNRTAEGRAQNRRVAISILTDRRDDPKIPVNELQSPTPSLQIPEQSSFSDD